MVAHQAQGQATQGRNLWKAELQKLADDTGLVLKVHHYPPGTSKWNKIEHRLFCHITQNWRGRPLTDRLAVVELIAATTTKAELKIESALDPRTYQKASKSATPRWKASTSSAISSILNGTIRSDHAASQTRSGYWLGYPKAPPDERGGNKYVQPTATAPHSDFTLVV